MKVLAFITDLFFQSSVAETARQAGADLQIVTSLYKFIPELAKKPDCVVIDLQAEGINPSVLISQVKSTDRSIRVVAFGRHTEKEALEQARLSGADDVMARSRFSKALPKLLGK